jgi:hypothetical protein
MDIRNNQFTYGRHGRITTGQATTPAMDTDVLIIDAEGLISTKNFWIFNVSGTLNYSIYGTGDGLMTKDEFESHPVSILEELVPTTAVSTIACHATIGQYKWLKVRINGAGDHKIDFAGA